MRNTFLRRSEGPAVYAVGPAEVIETSDDRSPLLFATDDELRRSGSAHALLVIRVVDGR